MCTLGAAQEGVGPVRESRSASYAQEKDREVRDTNTHVGHHSLQSWHPIRIMLLILVVLYRRGLSKLQALVRSKQARNRYKMLLRGMTTCAVWWRYWHRRRRRRQQLSFVQFGLWTTSQAHKVFALVLGWRVRRQWQTTAVANTLLELQETMAVLKEFDEPQQQGVMSATESALRRQLVQQLTALKMRFHDCFFKTARWQPIPEPGNV